MTAFLRGLGILIALASIAPPAHAQIYSSDSRVARLMDQAQRIIAPGSRLHDTLDRLVLIDDVRPLGRVHTRRARAEPYTCGRGLLGRLCASGDIAPWEVARLAQRIEAEYSDNLRWNGVVRADYNYTGVLILTRYIRALSGLTSAVSNLERRVEEGLEEGAGIIARRALTSLRRVQRDLRRLRSLAASIEAECGVGARPSARAIRAAGRPVAGRFRLPRGYQWTTRSQIERFCRYAIADGIPSWARQELPEFLQEIYRQVTTDTVDRRRSGHDSLEDLFSSVDEYERRQGRGRRAFIEGCTRHFNAQGLPIRDDEGTTAGDGVAFTVCLGEGYACRSLTVGPSARPGTRFR